MPFFLHSSVKVTSHFFELPVQRHIEALEGGAEIRGRAMQVHPYGELSCYLGVGGVQCEVRRYRGFDGEIPNMPRLMDLEHANTYRTGQMQMREHWREDQFLAACVGGIVGVMVGIGAMGVASVFTSHIAIVSLPAVMALPGALAIWAPELHRMRLKDKRLRACLTLIEGLERPHIPSFWQQAVEAAHVFGQSDDPFLRELHHQFVEAKGNILPRYDELGIYLPTYYPPDGHSSAGGYQPIEGDDLGANS